MLGALNLYSPLPAVFGAGERARARIYADQAAITLAAVLRWSSVSYTHLTLPTKRIV